MRTMREICMQRRAEAMTKKTDLTIYRDARVERRFQESPGTYWVSIPGIGTRKIVRNVAEKPLQLGSTVQVWWHRKGRTWIKKD